MIRTTPYFGGKEPLSDKEKVEVAKIRSNLEFDEKSVNNIAQKVFNGMIGMRGSPNGNLSQDDLRKWTQAIMANPNTIASCAPRA